jgi:poly(A) polymerase/tRNA nucleotidyltransferase (CCA-adding enzyme)
VLLDRVPEDYDIATDAYPEEIEKLFPKSIPTGAKFGTITVVAEDEHGERFDVEVTTYRSEADYLGGRWPAKVEFTKTIEEDLARRDFTINAMALNLQEFDTLQKDNDGGWLHELLVDPFDGLKDLEDKVINAVGDAMERLGEDGLRAVRACRLAAQLGFVIAENTFEAIKKTNHITKQVSIERFRDELLKLLYKAPKPSTGLKLMRDTGILELFIPELLEGQNVTQPQYHVDDVFDHSLKTLDIAEDEIKLAALFHDIAKPRTMSEDEKGIHFYGHDQEGAKLAKEILTRLKFPKAEVEQVSKLIRWHMFYYPSADWRNIKKDDFDYANADKDEIRKHIADTTNKKSPGGWSDAAIRRLIQNVGGEDEIDKLMKLRISDAGANPKSEFNPGEMEVLADRIAEVRAKDMALKVTDLDITGDDLMKELNIPPGPKLGKILVYLLDQVIEDPLLNEKQQLLDLATKQMVNI